MRDWIPIAVLVSVCGMLMYLLISTQAVFVTAMNQATEQMGFSHELLTKMIDVTERQEREIAAWHKRNWVDGKSGNPKEGGKK